MPGSNPPEMFLGKGVLKICSKFTGEHPCRSAISIKLQSTFIKTALQHGVFSCTLFPMNTSGRLLLNIIGITTQKMFWRPIESKETSLVATNVTEKEHQWIFQFLTGRWFNTAQKKWRFLLRNSIVKQPVSVPRLNPPRRVPRWKTGP